MKALFSPATIVLAEPRLRDPDGHQIRFYDAGVNRLNPPWRIDQS